MARIVPLFSSSKGNMTYVGSSSSGVLIDAGCGIRALREAMFCSSLDISSIKAVCITHEHTDHIKGISSILRHLRLPVYATKGTLDHLTKTGCVEYERGLFEISSKPFEVAGMQVGAFKTSHDAADSCGFSITASDGRTVGFCTDLGCVTQEVFKGLSGCNLIMVESNYDRKMLAEGSYPPSLKRRIESPTGHLENTVSADLIDRLIESGTAQVVLAHLSEQNNRPDLAHNKVRKILSERGKTASDYALYVALPVTKGENIIF